MTRDFHFFFNLQIVMWHATRNCQYIMSRILQMHGLNDPYHQYLNQKAKSFKKLYCKLVINNIFEFRSSIFFFIDNMINISTLYVQLCIYNDSMVSFNIFTLNNSTDVSYYVHTIYMYNKLVRCLNTAFSYLIFIIYLINNDQ